MNDKVREEAYDQGFEDGKNGWFTTEWIEGAYADYYWEGYDEAVRLFGED